MELLKDAVPARLRRLTLAAAGALALQRRGDAPDHRLGDGDRVHDEVEIAPRLAARVERLIPRRLLRR